MYLKLKENGDLVEILDLQNLFDPFQGQVSGRLHAGEEMGDPGLFTKSALTFPSDEPLPRCWTDGKYRESRLT